MSDKAAKFMAKETAKMVRSMVKSSDELDALETAMEEFCNSLNEENDEDRRNALVNLFAKASQELESGPRRSEKSRRKRHRKSHKTADKSKSGVTETAEATHTSDEVEQASPEQAPEQEQTSYSADYIEPKQIAVDDEGKNILDTMNCDEGICSPLDPSAKPNSKNSCIDVMIAAGKYNSQTIIDTVGCSKDTLRKRISKLSKMNHTISVGDDNTISLLVSENV